MLPGAMKLRVSENGMQKDFRRHRFFIEAEQLTREWLRPGSREASSLSQLMASPDGTVAAAAAVVCDELQGHASTRIALVDLASGAIEIVTHGPRSDSSPKWSPDGRSIAFLSDREHAHVNRLRILDVQSRAERAGPRLDGFVESVEWSADGRSLLLCVADFGSDLAGAQGAFAVGRDHDATAQADWAPKVEGVPESSPRRSAWIYDVAADSVRRITSTSVNVWQASWAGADHIVAICSEHPEETCWYTADVRLIALEDGRARTLFQPEDQLNCVVATPSGNTIAVIEAVCSDRNLVAGDLRLIDVASGTISRAKTLDADVTQLIWRDEDTLLFGASQGPDYVAGLFDRRTDKARELWRDSRRQPSGPIFPAIALLGNRHEDFLCQVESFSEAPVLIAYEGGTERAILGFATPELDARIQALGVTARDFTWTAPDGLVLHGWLVAPAGDGPHPLIMHVHGGPVWHVRPQYIGRSALQQMALAAGYALFLPNPRGSSGRGQAFARQVFGDMGGRDTHDYLSGLDALASQGLVDPARIGVMGVSYGGYISAWLITQDQRFAAAVPIAPVTNWVSQHLSCNVPTFCELFLRDKLDDPLGQYFSRSPIHHAERVRTPTLHVCGALDRITPAGQALEFHRALQGSTDVESVLLTYPHEGHGISSMPASFDFAARVMHWFDRHMPARPARSGKLEEQSGVRATLAAK
ncbi:S9 family peptidase [Burkholderia gladioli]|nr:S9 family peptidase [Burkholderia gladioli]